MQHPLGKRDGLHDHYPDIMEYGSQDLVDVKIRMEGKSYVWDFLGLEERYKRGPQTDSHYLLENYERNHNNRLLTEYQTITDQLDITNPMLNVLLSEDRDEICLSFKDKGYSQKQVGNPVDLNTIIKGIISLYPKLKYLRSDSDFYIEDFDISYLGGLKDLEGLNLKFQTYSNKITGNLGGKLTKLKYMYLPNSTSISVFSQNGIYRNPNLLSLSCETNEPITLNLEVAEEVNLYEISNYDFKLIAPKLRKLSLLTGKKVPNGFHIKADMFSLFNELKFLLLKGQSYLEAGFLNSLLNLEILILSHTQMTKTIRYGLYGDYAMFWPGDGLIKVEFGKITIPSLKILTIHHLKIPVTNLAKSFPNIEYLGFYDSNFPLSGTLLNAHKSLTNLVLEGSGNTDPMDVVEFETLTHLKLLRILYNSGIPVQIASSLNKWNIHLCGKFCRMTIQRNNIRYSHQILLSVWMDMVTKSSRQYMNEDIEKAYRYWRILEHKIKGTLVSSIPDLVDWRRKNYTMPSDFKNLDSYFKDKQDAINIWENGPYYDDNFSYDEDDAVYSYSEEKGDLIFWWDEYMYLIDESIKNNMLLGNDYRINYRKFNDALIRLMIFLYRIKDSDGNELISTLAFALLLVYEEEEFKELKALPSKFEGKKHKILQMLVDWRLKVDDYMRQWEYPQKYKLNQ